VQVPDALVQLAKSAHKLFSDENTKTDEDTLATTPRMDSTLGRKAELDSLVKASEQFTKAMKQSGVSQATLMVGPSCLYDPLLEQILEGGLNGIHA
jgi:hypothetical protein